MRTLVQTVLLLIVSLPASAAMDQYRIRFDAGELKAHVEAELHVSDGQVAVSDYGAWSQERGWATFVSALIAQDPKGYTYNLSEVDKHGWQVEEFGSPAVVHLSYEVDLSHAETRRGLR